MDITVQLAVERIRPYLQTSGAVDADAIERLLRVGCIGLDPNVPSAIRARAAELAAGSPALFRLNPETAPATREECEARQAELRRMGIV